MKKLLVLNQIYIILSKITILGTHFLMPLYNKKNNIRNIAYVRF